MAESAKDHIDHVTQPRRKKTKIDHTTDIPHRQPTVPELSPKDQETALELLCAILEPLGRYRAQFLNPSKGKRASKRRRRAQKDSPSSNTRTHSPQFPAPPPPPDLSHTAIVGFNAITRHLEALAAASPPQSSPETPSSTTLPPPLAALFYTPTTLPPLLTHNLPLLTHLASFSHPSTTPPTRLIPLTLPSAPNALSTALHQPRVSFIGLFNTPTPTIDDDDGSAPVKTLINFCREKVPPIHVPWLENVEAGKYAKVRIQRVESVIGEKNKEEKRRKRRDRKNKGKEKPGIGSAFSAEQGKEVKDTAMPDVEGGGENAG
ncbi:MAG: hypothetical protein Q9227_004980 [Pyrenula ochraceoflavens]